MPVRKPLEAYTPDVKLHMCSKPGCTYGTPEKCILTRHLLSHGEGVKYPCPHEGCGFSTGLRTNLKRHGLTHLPPEERPTFQCPQCPKVLVSKDRLRLHQRVEHEGGYKRPESFKCSEVGCEDTPPFRTKHQRELHRMHVHMAHLEPLVCGPDCGYQTLCRRSFLKHSKTSNHSRAKEKRLRAERLAVKEARWNERQEALARKLERRRVREEAAAREAARAAASQYARSCEEQYARYRAYCEVGVELG